MGKYKFPLITEYLAERGVSFVTDIRKEGKGTVISNTYFVEVGKQNYLIDPACGKKRLKQIRSHLTFDAYDVLVTHSHIDHSGNSRFVMAKGSDVIFHPLVAGKINNFKRNYTDVTVEMVKIFGVEGFFGRTGILGPFMIKTLQFIERYFPTGLNFIMKMVGLVICRIEAGSVSPPKKNVLFLNYDEIQDLSFGKNVFKGWPLNEHLFALDTPGHQDDHLSFYLPDKKIMFSGDLISFLNPNDILDGSIKETKIGMKKMLQLAEDGGIDVLALSHQLPIIGKDKVISYLDSIVREHEEVFNIVAETVSSHPDKTDLTGIISKVCAHDSDLMKKILKINYPRSNTFIEVYVYIYLKEFVNYD
ncbi:MAG TPA: MBL fold metallo-hydrolase [Syntrophomonadaceae bacterium]|nr:MBL fold metallo-hydrolase [Syntrophomonadaceae bacterium]